MKAKIDLSCLRFKIKDIFQSHYTLKFHVERQPTILWAMFTKYRKQKTIEVKKHSSDNYIQISGELETITWYKDWLKFE